MTCRTRKDWEAQVSNNTKKHLLATSLRLLAFVLSSRVALAFLEPYTRTKYPTKYLTYRFCPWRTKAQSEHWDHLMAGHLPILFAFLQSTSSPCSLQHQSRLQTCQSFPRNSYSYGLAGSSRVPPLVQHLTSYSHLQHHRAH